MKDYSIPDEAIAVYTKKANGLNDTAISGTMQVTFYQTYNYSVPEQSFPLNSSNETNTSELIGGTFDFYTKTNAHIYNGVYVIVFNN